MPGLGLLLDPGRLLGHLAGQLDISRVNDIRLDYIRYKPTMNCLTRYQLSVDGHEVTAYGKTHGQDAAGKLEKSTQRAVLDGELGPGRVTLKDQQIIFSTFPNDAKLAGLRCIEDGELRKKLFIRLFGQHSPWLESRFDQKLNYKPERRYVARVKRADGELALLKFYSSGGFDQARIISRKLSRSHHDFYPETIGRTKKHKVIAYNWQAGTTLRLLSMDGKLALSDLTLAAESLAEFHTSRREGLAMATSPDRSKQIYALATQLGILLPALEQRAESVAQQLIQWLVSNPTVALPVHGDFYDKQVIVHTGKARLIDLDAARLDNPLVDLGNYISHLLRQIGRGQLSMSEYAARKDVLLTGYEQATGSIDEQQLDNYIALGLFALIHQPFRDWEPDWPAKTQQLLKQVEDLLAA